MDDNKPIHTIRRGGVEAAIWKNIDKEKTRYSVKLSKSFRDGEKHKSTQVFLARDLILIARVAELADAWVYEQFKLAGNNV